MAGDTSTQGPIDPLVIEDIRSIGDGLLGEVLQLYSDDSPQRIAAMRDAITKGEALALARAAHALKSSSGNVGALAVTSLCREIEEIGRAGSVSGAAVKLDELEREYERALDALRALVAVA